MQYYKPFTKSILTASQLERRGQLNDEVMQAIGIYELKEDVPHHDSRYQQLTNERVTGDEENGFALEWDVEYLPLEQLKQAKSAELTGALNAFLLRESTEYCDMERATWDKQREEAKALLNTPDAPAPMVRSIAAARDIDVIEMAKRIMANTKAWSVLAGHATGQRLALQDKVTAAKTPEDVIAIEVEFTMPEAPAEAEENE